MRIEKKYGNVLMNAVLLCILPLVLCVRRVAPEQHRSRSAGKHTREPPGYGDSGTGNEEERRSYSGYHNPIALY